MKYAYVVLSGCYSGVVMHCIFLIKEEAEEYCTKLNNRIKENMGIKDNLSADEERDFLNYNGYYFEEVPLCDSLLEKIKKEEENIEWNNKLMLEIEK